MSHGLLVAGQLQLRVRAADVVVDSLREDWHYIPSTGDPDHAFKLNWVYELPFGQGRKWGSGAGGFLNALIGGWEWDGVTRVQTGEKFDFGGFRLVGMNDQEFQDMFKFYHEKDANGVERIYMFPQDVIANSILALYTDVGDLVRPGIPGALPTGRYLAPASGPDCVQYHARHVPGHGRDAHCHGADVLEGRHELREAVPVAAGGWSSKPAWTSSTCSTPSTSRRRPRTPRIGST